MTSVSCHSGLGFMSLPPIGIILLRPRSAFGGRTRPMAVFSIWRPQPLLGRLAQPPAGVVVMAGDRHQSSGLAQPKGRHAAINGLIRARLHQEGLVPDADIAIGFAYALVEGGPGGQMPMIPAAGVGL